MLEEELIPIFPAAVVKRYVNPNHEDTSIDDMEFFGNQGSLSKSSDRSINILETPRFADLSAFLNRCIVDSNSRMDWSEL